MFKIVYRDIVLHDFEGLDPKTRKLIKYAIEAELVLDPHVVGLPLKRSLKGYWKLRVGEYRIIYRIVGRKIFVVCVGHRSSVYAVVQDRVK